MVVACSKLVSRRHRRGIVHVGGKEDRTVLTTSDTAIDNLLAHRRLSSSTPTIAFPTDTTTHNPNDAAIASDGDHPYPLTSTNVRCKTNTTHSKSSGGTTTCNVNQASHGSTGTLALNEILSSSPYLHNAKLIAPFSISLDSSKVVDRRDQQLQEQTLVHDEIFKILQEIIPCFLSFWHIDGPSHLVVRPLQGGLSNYLYTVQPRTKEYNTNMFTSSDSDTMIPCSILVRIHEDATATTITAAEDDDTPLRFLNDKRNLHVDLVNRCTENHISAVLSSKGLAPTYFGRFQNGRLEEFCENVRPLKHIEMKIPVICKEIARQLGTFHKISYRDLYWDDEDGVGGDVDGVGGGMIWKRVDEWLQVANKWYDTSGDKQQQQDNDAIMLVEISKEWSWLKGELMGSRSRDTFAFHTVQSLARTVCREIVFAHMDCQSLNILIQCQNSIHDNDVDDDDNDREETSFESTTTSSSDKDGNHRVPLQFIDFEYAGMNPRAADIGNTFCEFCDMNNLYPDYTKDYPSDSVQNMFLMSYIHANDDALANTVKDMTPADKDLFLSTMRQEIGKHTLISHLGWAVWSLIQNKQSSIEFDYIRYAEIRMEGYRMFKNQFW
jgi:ethanolamine kinase